MVSVHSVDTCPLVGLKLVVIKGGAALLICTHPLMLKGRERERERRGLSRELE